MKKRNEKGRNTPCSICGSNFCQQSVYEQWCRRSDHRSGRSYTSENLIQKEGRTVNALAGYVNEMDVTAMRDTITPLEANGTLQIQIEEFGNKITGVEYKVYSLNGEETYLEGKQKDISDETILLDLKKGLPDEVSEAVLEVILSMEEEQAHFYTRITRPDELSLKECLDFARIFMQRRWKKTVRRN